RRRAGEGAGQMNVAAREADVLAFLDLDASCGTRDRAFALPRERGDCAGGVAVKCDPRLDRLRNGDAWASKELVAVSGIQNPHLAGFIERDERLRLAESGE